MALNAQWGEDRWVRVSFQGALDRDTVPELRRKVFRDVLKRRPNGVRVDVSTVERVDTAGLAFLLEMRNVVKGRGAPFHLEGLTDSLRRLVSLARLDNLLFENPPSS